MEKKKRRKRNELSKCVQIALQGHGILRSRSTPPAPWGDSTERPRRKIGPTLGHSLKQSNTSWQSNSQVVRRVSGRRASDGVGLDKPPVRLFSGQDQIAGENFPIIPVGF